MTEEKNGLGVGLNNEGKGNLNIFLKMGSLEYVLICRFRICIPYNHSCQSTRELSLVEKFRRKFLRTVLSSLSTHPYKVPGPAQT